MVNEVLQCKSQNLKHNELMRKSLWSITILAIAISPSTSQVQVLDVLAIFLVYFKCLPNGYLSLYWFHWQSHSLQNIDPIQEVQSCGVMRGYVLTSLVVCINGKTFTYVILTVFKTPLNYA